jgi:uncharacterized protein YjbI with pentapeptide repeats
VADIIVVKQNVAEKVAVNPAPVTITGATLVPATNATLGGIIVGDNLSITGNGVLSVANTFQPKLANTTYGLTNTGIISNDSEYYVNGEYVTDGLKKYYIGLRGQKYLPTGEQYGELYAVGSYKYNANGTLQSATSVETDGINLSLVSSNTQGFSTVVSKPGIAAIVASNATSQSIISLGDGVISGNAQGGYFRLRGNLGGTGDNSQDYQLVFGPNSGFDRGISFQQVALKSTIGFQYTYTVSSISYSMTNGLVFDNTPGLGGFTGNPGSHTSFQHTTDAVISGVRTGTEIRASRNKAELFYLNISPVYTSNSILTQGYADTRYQAVGSYLTSANLTFANLTGTPTTLAGYGITDGLTSANLTPYLTISSANATYAVLGHTHSIANVTGLQTALDLKLPSANFTYANITGTPNLTVYLTTANATATYQPLGNYATTSCLTFANLTGKPTTLSGYGITDGYSTSNPSGYITAGANSFTGAQNLQDNELFRAKLRDYSETVSSPTISAGTLVLNLETSNIFTVALNAAITTLTISNPPASGSGGSFTLIFTADGTARAVTWPTSIKWAGGTAPTITSTSGKVDSFAFFSSDGGTSWQGYVGGQNF